MAIFVKDPAAIIDYAIDWSADYLGSQVITSSVWRVAPDDVDGIAVAGASAAPGRTVVTLSGGRSGCLYQITNSVGFADSRSDERTLVVRVEDR